MYTYIARSPVACLMYIYIYENEGGERITLDYIATCYRLHIIVVAWFYNGLSALTLIRTPTVCKLGASKYSFLLKSNLTSSKNYATHKPFEPIYCLSSNLTANYSMAAIPSIACIAVIGKHVTIFLFFIIDMLSSYQANNSNLSNRTILSILPYFPRTPTPLPQHLLLQQPTLSSPSCSTLASMFLSSVHAITIGSIRISACCNRLMSD